MRVRGEDDLARLAASFNRMATSLQRQIRQLEDLSRVQRRFVSDVSHELRTPLTTVRMAADVLHEARTGLRPGGRAQRRDPAGPARPVRGAARRPAGDQPVRRRRGRPRGRADRPAGRRPARHRGDGDPRRAPGQRAAAASRRPCPASPRSTAGGSSGSCATWSPTRSSTARAGRSSSGSPPTSDAVAVAVRDHGVGLEPEEVGMVFNRFWRADPARARTTGGTGLGLSIALEDAHLHGGWLQAWGEPGDGCQFRLTLPRELGGELEGSPIPLEPMDSHPAPAAGDRRRAVPPDPHPGRRRCLSRRCRSPAARSRLLVPVRRRAARGLRDDPDLRPGAGRRRPAAAAGRRRRAGHRAAADARGHARRTSCSASCSPAPTSATTTRSPASTSRRARASAGARRRAPSSTTGTDRRRRSAAGDRHASRAPRSAGSTARAASGGRRPGPPVSRDVRHGAGRRRVADRRPGRRAAAVRGRRRGDLPPGLAVLPGAVRADPGARPRAAARSCPA